MTPPRGISTLGRGAERLSGGVWDMDPDAIKRLEELSKKLNG